MKSSAIQSLRFQPTKMIHWSTKFWKERETWSLLLTEIRLWVQLKAIRQKKFFDSKGKFSSWIFISRNCINSDSDVNWNFNWFRLQTTKLSFALFLHLSSKLLHLNKHKVKISGKETAPSMKRASELHILNENFDWKQKKKLNQIWVSLKRIREKNCLLSDIVWCN